jgi:hypothetical protein
MIGTIGVSHFEVGWSIGTLVEYMLGVHRLL